MEVFVPLSAASTTHTKLSNYSYLLSLRLDVLNNPEPYQSRPHRVPGTTKNTTEMSLGADVWGYITGVLSVLAVILQLIRMNLPSTKLKEFDDVLKETEDLLHDADEEGLLNGGKFVHQTNETLIRLRKTIQPLRSRVHVAKTTSQQCLGIFTGLSVRISFLCSEVKEVKAQIATTSDQARETLRQLDLIHNQQEAHRTALDMLSNEEASDVSDGGDVSLSEDLGGSDNLRKSGSQCDDEVENKTLNEAENERPSMTVGKSLTYHEDIMHAAIESMEGPGNTTVACEAA